LKFSIFESKIFDFYGKYSKKGGKLKAEKEDVDDSKCQEKI